MLDVRANFDQAAGSDLRLDKFTLTRADGGGWVLSVAGWHADGTPFAIVTAPFRVHPEIRARELARDIIRSHTGLSVPATPVAQPVAPSREPAPVQHLRSYFEMSKKGSGLARLVGSLKDTDTIADKLADRLEAALKNLAAEMATTEMVVGNVEQSVSDLRAVNAQYSNGDPTIASSGD